MVLLRQRGPRRGRWRLTAPLRPDADIKVADGAFVRGSDVIGRRPLDELVDSGGQRVELHEASLAGYVVYKRGQRVATPIYPHDANTIVALLDLHPTRPGEDEAGEGGDAAPFEVLEAGSGMGSLTLHLARALHAANPPVPPALRRALRAGGPPAAGDAEALAAYAAARRAVVHSVDRNPGAVDAARCMVRGFRRALYLATVDFEAADAGAWLARRLAASGGAPFLARAVLDLAAPAAVAARLVTALRPGSLLVVFQPSISQLAEFDAWRHRRCPAALRLDKALELPVTTSAPDALHGAAGGREWDVRLVMPRAGDERPPRPGPRGPAPAEPQPVQVLRPKVGGRVAAGGFVAVYRRWPGEPPPVDEAEPAPDQHGYEPPAGEAGSVLDQDANEPPPDEAESVPDQDDHEPPAGEAEPVPDQQGPPPPPGRAGP